MGQQSGAGVAYKQLSKLTVKTLNRALHGCVPDISERAARKSRQQLLEQLLRGQLYLHRRMMQLELRGRLPMFPFRRIVSMYSPHDMLSSASADGIEASRDHRGRLCELKPSNNGRTT